MFTVKHKTRGIKELPFEYVRSLHAKEEEGSKFVEIDGIDLHYRDEGKGPVILLLHGICDSLHTWTPWCKSLSQDYRVIRFDLPFFGLSQVKSDHKITKEFYPIILDKIINHFGLDQFYLCGHSLGGWISWNYALKHQSKLKKLILISPPGKPNKPPLIVRATGHGLIKKLASIYTPKYLADLAIEEIFHDPNFMSEHQRNRYYEILMAEGNRKNYMDVFSMMIKYAGEWPKGLENLMLQTLIIWGKNDAWVPARHSEYWQKTLPNLTLELFDSVGHVPQEESVEPTLKAFTSFLKT
ncbi:MAG: alpha/beta hydrolase [Bacteriovoracaceae bacterium]|nr:alpha/beta hydrolase [Bacteriovoracaceae bacterium]